MCACVASEREPKVLCNQPFVLFEGKNKKKEEKKSSLIATHARSLTNNKTKQKKIEEKRFFHCLTSFTIYSFRFVSFLSFCFLRCYSREKSSFRIIFFSCRIWSMSHECNAFGCFSWALKHKVKLVWSSAFRLCVHNIQRASHRYVVIFAVAA